MNVLWHILARFNQTCARRARAAASRFEARAERLFARIKGGR